MSTSSSRAEELREAYELLSQHARFSKKFFTDQYTKFGMRGIRQLIALLVL